MPAASLAQRQTNLARVNGSLSEHCPTTVAVTAQARIWAAKMPLTHATAFGNLADILHNGALLSQVQLGLPAGYAEALFETADDVFLYATAFSYPNTECGFLFVPSLEADHTADGIATPFDSGAMAGHVDPPAAYADRVSFVRDYELPVSDYRQTLESVMAAYSPSPETYLSFPENVSCHCTTARDHPCGLVGGDRRANTFEVRIPQRVALQPPHLRAVFVREGFEISDLHELFASGVTIERYQAEDGDDFFHAMRECCISFIQNRLFP
jgi:hypothetical protein